MKERPILFSAPMVRAILEGRKTQTRRVVKPQPDHCHRDIIGKQPPHDPKDFARLIPQIGDTEIRCPYGAPGDRLWVRETWAGGITADSASVDYRADGKEYGADCDGVPLIRWRSSIHMPRWASRITLEVTGVRVERLQNCSESDAFAEGVDGVMGTARSQYADLWCRINGPGSWAANPWIWVIEFKRVSQ